MQTRWTKYLLLAGLVLIIFSMPVVLTQYSYFKTFNFTQTGQIGDTIGGITAPFINLLGAILVFLSFKQQIKANEIQTNALLNEIKRNENERKYNSLMTDINNLRADINEFTLFGKTVKTGTYALHELETSVKDWNAKSLMALIESPHFKNFYFLIATTQNILRKIQVSELSDFEKKDLTEKLIYLFSSKISSHAINILSYYQKNKVENPLVNMLIKAVDELRQYMVDHKI